MIGVHVELDRRRRVDRIDDGQRDIHLRPRLPDRRDFSLGEIDVLPHRRTGGVQLGDHIAPQIVDKIPAWLRVGIRSAKQKYAVGRAGVGDDARDQLIEAEPLQLLMFLHD